ncbi:MAG: DoxX family protein [Flavobacteriales bacterium]|nr:DoxX family protein [Flavobacteriales bacterium]
MELLMMNDCGIMAYFGGLWVLHALISAFLAILFLQSALDKTFHYRGNLDWLKGHFAASLLAGTVPMLMAVLTFMEMLAGMVCAVGVVETLLYRTFCFSFAGTLLSGITLLMLFFGQRIAKDYAGAAALVPYFILVVIQLIFLV